MAVESGKTCYVTKSCHIATSALLTFPLAEAFRMYPNLKRYIIITDKSSTSYRKVLSEETQKKVQVMQILNGSFLHPVSGSTGPVNFPKSVLFDPLCDAMYCGRSTQLATSSVRETPTMLSSPPLLLLCDTCCGTILPPECTLYFSTWTCCRSPLLGSRRSLDPPALSHWGW